MIYDNIYALFGGLWGYEGSKHCRKEDGQWIYILNLVCYSLKQLLTYCAWFINSQENFFWLTTVSLLSNERSSSYEQSWVFFTIRFTCLYTLPSLIKIDPWLPEKIITLSKFTTTTIDGQNACLCEIFFFIRILNAS